MDENNPSADASLSKREQEVFQLLLEGKSNGEISSSLAITEKTVEEHLTNIYKKLGVKSRTEAVLRGISQNRDSPHWKDGVEVVISR